MLVRHDGRMTFASEIRIVAADHPTYERDIAQFLAELRAERRFFGPTASANPKPFPSLIVGLEGRGGFRTAAVECGRFVGLARVDGAGELLIAVSESRRGIGIGTMLGRAATERAADLHYGRIVLRSTRRSRAARRVGEQLGCLVVEHARGRTDLLIPVGRQAQSA